MPENYMVNVKCKNCGASKYFTIPKGKAVPDFLEDKECDFCECSILNKKEEEN